MAPPPSRRLAGESFGFPAATASLLPIRRLARRFVRLPTQPAPARAPPRPPARPAGVRFPHHSNGSYLLESRRLARRSSAPTTPAAASSITELVRQIVRFPTTATLGPLKIPPCLPADRSTSLQLAALSKIRRLAASNRSTRHRQLALQKSRRLARQIVQHYSGDRAAVRGCPGESLTSTGSGSPPQIPPARPADRSGTTTAAHLQIPPAPLRRDRFLPTTPPAALPKSRQLLRLPTTSATPPPSANPAGLPGGSFGFPLQQRLTPSPNPAGPSGGSFDFRLRFPSRSFGTRRMTDA